jgi:hypothetical protein
MGFLKKIFLVVLWVAIWQTCLVAQRSGSGSGSASQMSCVRNPARCMAILGFYYIYIKLYYINIHIYCIYIYPFEKGTLQSIVGIAIINKQ